jgi:putative transposase
MQDSSKTRTALIRSKSTAFGRATRSASSDPAWIPLSKAEAPPSGKAPWGRTEEPLHAWQSPSPVRWECKDHGVIIPKDRREVCDGRPRHPIGPILRDLCRPRGVERREGHATPDHIPLCLSIPPKSGAAHPIGFLKGQSAVRIHRGSLNGRRTTGLHFRATGYCASTVGPDEARGRQSLREPDELDRRRGELDLESHRRPRRGLPDRPPPTGATSGSEPRRGSRNRSPRRGLPG